MKQKSASSPTAGNPPNSPKSAATANGNSIFTIPTKPAPNSWNSCQKKSPAAATSTARILGRNDRARADAFDCCTSCRVSQSRGNGRRPPCGGDYAAQDHRYCFRPFVCQQHGSIARLL